MGKSYSKFYSVHVTRCYVYENNVFIDAAIMYMKKDYFFKFRITDSKLFMEDHILSSIADDMFEEIINVEKNIDGVIKALLLSSWILYENRLAITRIINKLEV